MQKLEIIQMSLLHHGYANKLEFIEMDSPIFEQIGVAFDSGVSPHPEVDFYSF